MDISEANISVDENMNSKGFPQLKMSSYINS